MTNEDNYDKLINLLNKFHEDTDGSLTHINRSKRVIREIAETNYRLAVLLVKNMQFIPPNEFEELRGCAVKMTNSMEEFADFLHDYGEDLLKIGTDVVDIFAEFKVSMEKENENSVVE